MFLQTKAILYRLDSLQKKVDRLEEVKYEVDNMVSCSTCGYIGKKSDFIKGKSTVDKYPWGDEYVKQNWYCKAHYKIERKK